MEGLYVRSRQENNKAFRKWVKKKEKEERIQQEIHYRQVQVNFQDYFCTKRRSSKLMSLIIFFKAAKEELRTIKRNQKRNALLDAARVASILDYYWITAAIITVSKFSFSNLSIVTKLTFNFLWSLCFPLKFALSIPFYYFFTYCTLFFLANLVFY